MDNITLPTAVASFIAASNAHDANALIAVFSDDATVRDDGMTLIGHPQISEWIRSHLIAPKVVLTPTSFAGDRLVAAGDGDFPGGPLSFAFVFVIKDDQIADLTIEPA